MNPSSLRAWNCNPWQNEDLQRVEVLRCCVVENVTMSDFSSVIILALALSATSLTLLLFGLTPIVTAMTYFQSRSWLAHAIWDYPALWTYIFWSFTSSLGPGKSCRSSRSPHNFIKNLELWFYHFCIFLPYSMACLLHFWPFWPVFGLLILYGLISFFD